MPAPTIANKAITEAQQEAYDAVQEHGTIRAAARALGKGYSNVHRAYNSYVRKMNLDQAIADSMTAVGTGLIPALTWAKTKNPDGTSYSVLLKPQVDADTIAETIEQATDSALERIAVSAPYAPRLIRPKVADGALYGLLPLFDAHIGLQMAGYGLDEAVARLVNGAFEAIDAMPAAGRIAIINGGDFTHQNDDSNQTPQSKHPLPISANYTDTTDAATDARIAIIEYAARKFDRVETKDLIGNHDPATAKIIRAALRQRYREDDRVEVDLVGLDFWETIFGQNLITMHHGDIKRALKDLALSLCQKYRAQRGVTKFHEHHTGHLHHIKETRFDMGGVHFCQHGAISRKSNYDEANVYEGDSILQGITYHERGGRKSTIEVHLE
jgi:hypothetical protein